MICLQNWFIVPNKWLCSWEKSTTLIQCVKHIFCVCGVGWRRDGQKKNFWRCNKDIHCDRGHRQCCHYNNICSTNIIFKGRVREACTDDVRDASDARRARAFCSCSCVLLVVGASTSILHIYCTLRRRRRFTSILGAYLFRTYTIITTI